MYRKKANIQEPDGTENERKSKQEKDQEQKREKQKKVLDKLKKIEGRWSCVILQQRLNIEIEVLEGKTVIVS